MSLSDELRAQRVRHLHARFLDASRQNPALYHVAIRPHDPKYWTTVSLDWSDENPCVPHQGVATIDYEGYEKLHERHYAAHVHWWRNSIAVSKWRTRQSELVRGVHRLILQDGQWAGRYTCPELTEWGSISNGKVSNVLDVLNIVRHFEQLAEEALFDILLLEESNHSFQSPTYEHTRGWLEYLYQLFPAEAEDLGNVSIIGLPWNVFDASARAIELLADENRASDATLSEAEARIMNVVRTAGKRLTTEQIVAELERRHGAASEGTTKVNLATLRRRGLLTNRQDVVPKGYGLPEWE